MGNKISSAAIEKKEKQENHFQFKDERKSLTLNK
jgi:hypothetical protein